MPRGAVIPAPKIAAWAISDDHFSVMPIRWQQRADAEFARALPSDDFATSWAEDRALVSDAAEAREAAKAEAEGSRWAN